MCAWQAQGPYLAMATERGQCIVWHFPAKEIVKELGPNAMRYTTSTEGDDEETDTSFTFSSESCVRLVKFNPVPLFNYSTMMIINFVRLFDILECSFGVCRGQKTHSRRWHEKLEGTNHQRYGANNNMRLISKQFLTGILMACASHMTARDCVSVSTIGIVLLLVFTCSS